MGYKTNKMKKVLLLSVLFTSCITHKKDISIPLTKKSENKLKVISEYKIDAGILHIYQYGSDTLYIVEGANQSFPVAISIK